MKTKICLVLAFLAGIAFSAGCDQGATASAEAAAEAEGYYEARTDFSLIPADGLRAMDTELARREAQIVGGQDRRDDNSAEMAELTRIRAERAAIQEEMGRR